MQNARARKLREGKPGDGPVVYWMSRNQRARDNWALLYAQELALELKRPLTVLFYLAANFGLARESHFRFMLEGLRETAETLASKRIFFEFIGGKEGAGGTMAAAVRQLDAAALVLDFDPLRVKRKWYKETADAVHVPVYEVDARNVVPIWTASGKQEYAARTIRPKILKLLPEYLEEVPELKKHPYGMQVHKAGEASGGGVSGKRPGVPGLPNRIDFGQAGEIIRKLPPGPDVSWCPAGSKAAYRRLADFIAEKLSGYPEGRNDPNAAATSMLSPYLHFGQIASGRIAMEAERAAREGAASWEAADAFIEELVVRRELADNFCFYNEDYDTVKGFPDWGMKTLNKHRCDERPYLYSKEQLEAGETHDDLWNTAQQRLTSKGTMHGFLRMYWAKKILEWTESPEEAMEYCLEFNDSYQLDGRDPNGYTGIAWALGGVHDRPWKEREVFGTIRYMNYKGCKRKFDVAAYVENGGEPEML